MDASTERIVRVRFSRDVANSRPKGVTLREFASAWGKQKRDYTSLGSQEFQYPNSIWNTPENRTCIDEICRQVRMEPSPEFLGIILTSAPEPPSGP